MPSALPKPQPEIEALLVDGHDAIYSDETLQAFVEAMIRVRELNRSPEIVTADQVIEIMNRTPDISISEVCAMMRVYPQFSAAIFQTFHGRFIDPFARIACIEAYPPCAEAFLSEVIIPPTEHYQLHGKDIIRILLVHPHLFERLITHPVVRKMIETTSPDRFGDFAFELFKVFSDRWTDPAWDQFDSVLNHCVELDILSGDSVRRLLHYLPENNARKLLVAYLNQFSDDAELTGNELQALSEGLTLFPTVMFELLEDPVRQMRFSTTWGDAMHELALTPGYTAQYAYAKALYYACKNNFDSIRDEAPRLLETLLACLEHAERGSETYRNISQTLAAVFDLSAREGHPLTAELACRNILRRYRVDLLDFERDYSSAFAPARAEAPAGAGVVETLIARPK